MADSKKRMLNFSTNELLTMFKYYQENRTKLVSSFNSTVNAEIKNSLWELITAKVNLVSSTKRTVEQVRKKFNDFKAIVKKKRSDEKNPQKGTVGGPLKLVTYNEAEQAMLYLIEDVPIDGMPGFADCETLFDQQFPVFPGDASRVKAKPDPKPSKPESYQLRHNNHLSVVFQQLMEEEAFMDVTLTAEGQPVKAHKSVLSAVSPYFSSVLRANPSQHPVIIMPWHVKFFELSSIVNYVYKGEMTVAAEDLPSLLKTAEVLRITGLSPDDNSFVQQSPGNSSDLLTSFHPSEITKPAATSPSEINPAVNPADFIDVDMATVKEITKPAATSASEINPAVNPADFDFIHVDMATVKEEMASVSDEDIDRSDKPSPLNTSSVEKICLPSASSCRVLQPPFLFSSFKDRLLLSENETYPAEKLSKGSLQMVASLSGTPPPTNLSPSHDEASTSPPEPNVCPYCDEYLNSFELESHTSTKHPFKPAFLCKACLRIFARRLQYQQHAKCCHAC